MTKTTDEMIRELHIVMLGVPGTDEKGMAGDVKGMNKELKILNGAVKTNTTWRRAFCWILGLVTTALVTTIIFVLSARAPG